MLLDRLLFTLVVARLMRAAGDADRAEAQRRFELTAAGVRDASAPHLPLLAEVCGGPRTTTEGLVALADGAPEPYRTMFADHLEGLERIGSELGGDRAVSGAEAAGAESTVLDQVLTRAVRGAVSGTAFPGLRSFVRPTIPGPVNEDA